MKYKYQGLLIKNKITIMDIYGNNKATVNKTLNKYKKELKADAIQIIQTRG